MILVSLFQRNPGLRSIFKIDSRGDDKYLKAMGRKCHQQQRQYLLWFDNKEDFEN